MITIVTVMLIVAVGGFFALSADNASFNGRF